MDKYYIEISVEKWNHAGTKARSDVAIFLEDAQVSNLIFDKEVSRAERFLFTKLNIKRKLQRAKPGDMIIVSHRLFWGKRFSNYLMKVIKKRKLKSVLIIHDVESLRQNFNFEQVKQEITQMNNFDIVISHNNNMTTWLKNSGVNSKIVNLNLFDYFNLSSFNHSFEKDRGVIFAGNLEKSVFLNKLENLKNKLSLYGPNPSSYSDNINYFGSFSPSELPAHLEGSYGLIWDGDSCEKCTGLSGEYLKYNNPHKTSLYLSCGLPVIIWKEAALAPFIESNNLGICVSSLQEMDHILLGISDDEYKIMKENALAMAEKLRSGYFIKKAIQKAESLLMEEK